MLIFDELQLIYNHAKEKSQTDPVIMSTSGLSCATFFKYNTQFFLKEVDFKSDAISIRTHDHGREFYVLKDSTLAPLWNIVNSPYHAIAIENQKYALLMSDLSQDIQNIPD